MRSITTHWYTTHAEEILVSLEGSVQEQVLKTTKAPMDAFVLIRDADIDKMSKVLEMRGISENGLKKDLVEKLKRAMVDKVPTINREITCAPCDEFSH